MGIDQTLLQSSADVSLSGSEAEFYDDVPNSPVVARKKSKNFKNLGIMKHLLYKDKENKKVSRLFVCSTSKKVGVFNVQRLKNLYLLYIMDIKWNT